MCNSRKEGERSSSRSRKLFTPANQNAKRQPSLESPRMLRISATFFWAIIVVEIQCPRLLQWASDVATLWIGVPRLTSHDGESGWRGGGGSDLVGSLQLPFVHFRYLNKKGSR
jgi:hypothetical protein